MKANVTTGCVISGPDDFGYEVNQKFKNVGDTTLNHLFNTLGAVVGRYGKTTAGDYSIDLTVGLTDAVTGAVVPIPGAVQPAVGFKTDRAGVEKFEQILLEENLNLLGKVKKGNQGGGHKGARGKP